MDFIWYLKCFYNLSNHLAMGYKDYLCIRHAQCRAIEDISETQHVTMY